MRRTTLALVSLGIAAWLATHFFATCGLPLLAEDYTEIAAIRGFRSVLEVFTTSHPPPRPFQHLEFYAATHWTSTEPWAMRLPLFALHAGTIAGVAALARALGWSGATALAAAALYACFPATHAIVYPASAGTVGRSLLLVWALAALVRSEGAPRAIFGSLACAVSALLFHQSAVVFAPIGWLCLAFGVGSARAATPLLAVRKAFHPVLLGFAIAVVAFVVVYRNADSPHTSLRSVASIAGNAVKAAFGVFPEDVRFFVVEGLRGRSGTVGQALGAVTVLLLALGALLVVLRGSRLARFCVLGIAVDLALPIATAGYSQRYTLFSGVLAAILAVELVRSRRRYVPCVLLLGAAWAYDTARATWNVREAGATVERLLATAARELGTLPPGQRLVVANTPLTWGRERDLMVLHWGLAEALSFRGVGDAFAIEQVRTETFPGETRARLVTTQDLEKLAADPAVRLLVFDPGIRDFRVSRKEGAPDKGPR